MFSIILYQPEIPPNTGNIIRLCANTGCHLHLIEPLGFSLDEKSLRRAGLDYHALAQTKVHTDLDSCLATITGRIFVLSTKGKTVYSQISFQEGDAFLFGAESCGLPSEVFARFAPEQILTLPQRTAARSLNLSNAAAIMVYEAWRQLSFKQV